MTPSEEHHILLARLDERYKALDGKLDDILAQCLKTNGRVTKSEGDINELFQWRSEFRGGWKATTAISAVIGAVAAYLGNRFFSN